MGELDQVDLRFTAIATSQNVVTTVLDRPHFTERGEWIVRSRRAG